MASFVIGLPIYILPFMFVYSPELLGIGGFTLDTAWRFITAAFGIAALSIACVGWMLRRLPVQERVLWFAASGVFIFPGAVTDTIAFAAFGALLAWSIWIARRQKAALTTT